MSQSTSRWDTSKDQYDPYDFTSNRRVQATDGPAASYWVKKLRLPHGTKARLEQEAAKHGYPSVDALIRDCIHRGLYALGQQSKDVHTTELANIWRMEDSAREKRQLRQAAEAAAREWHEALKECDGPEQFAAAIWELNQYRNSLPEHSMHRRHIEDVLARWIKQ